MDVGIEWGSTKAWDSFASHLDLINHALLLPSGRGNMYVKTLIGLAESIYRLPVELCNISNSAPLGFL